MGSLRDIRRQGLQLPPWVMGVNSADGERTSATGPNVAIRLADGNEQVAPAPDVLDRHQDRRVSDPLWTSSSLGNMHVTLQNLGLAWDVFATAHEVDERPECRRNEASAWIIEVETWTQGTPILQHAHQPALCQLLRYVTFKRDSQSHPGKRRIHGQAYIVDRQGTRYLDIHLLSCLSERPSIAHAGLGPSVVDACMLGQVLRHPWYAIRLEICG